MAARQNGMWDFASYDEKTWFRFLVLKLILTVIVYFILHVVFFNKKLNYEYSKLNQDQLQFVTRIYMDSMDPQHLTPSPDELKTGAGLGVKEPTGKSNPTKNNVPVAPQPPAPAKPTLKPTQVELKQELTKQALAPQTATLTPHDDSVRKAALSRKTMDYLNTVFENKLDSAQSVKIQDFITSSTPQQITTFLAGTQFKISSYFWLIGPCVYWEVVFWAIFGVLSSLLFNLGVVSNNATTNLTNPQSQFDPSQIFGQVSKILYAPLCTLVVVLGYYFFKDQNIVDIGSGKGVIVFAFIGGFYSGRLIALMDRLKDVLMPNTGTSSLPTGGNVAGQAIPIVTVKVNFATTANPAAVTAASATGINSATVTMRSTNSTNTYTGTRSPNDPVGVFTFTGIPAGNYLVSATLNQTLPDNSTVTLTGQLNGQILTSGSALLVTIA
ncbi:MAG: hypothetical protein JWP45_2907 [Mucilaginibacter sp.]|nr:hypothetical protein [Mucilaginibacter sp.]